MFDKHISDGLEIIECSEYQNISIIRQNMRYYIRMSVGNSYEYPEWTLSGFTSEDDAELFVITHDCNNATLSSISYIDEMFDNRVFSGIHCISDLIDNRILCAINTKDISKDLVRVRSSNVWAYGLNVKTHRDKTGDLLVQFKSKYGGAGDIYIYYDVPTIVYRRWQSAPSKGHYFWMYIRNNYKYSKLTGDKRGKLSNAV